MSVSTVLVQVRTRLRAMSSLRFRLSFSGCFGIAGLGQQTIQVSLVGYLGSDCYCGIRAGLGWVCGWIDLMIGSWSIRQV